VFSTGGDGFAVVFDDVGGAVAAAVESHGALTTDGFKVRMGIHVGQAFERDDNYFGPTVNRTARLMAAGHGGQVLLSEAAAALSRPGLSEGLRLVDLGLHWLRDLNQPEHVWQLEPDGESRSFPPLRTVAATTNLPVAEPLIGRDGDVGRVVDLVRSHRLVTITAPRRRGQESPGTNGCTGSR
jgi:class 3 adenylate cyclase